MAQQAVRARRESTGEELLLPESEILGRGGEAMVYAPAAHPGLVAKIYHASRLDRGPKLQVMLQAPPVDPMAGRGHISFTWPADLLRNRKGAVVGYLMPRIPRDRVKVFELFNPRTRRAKIPAFNHRYLHRTARNLAACLRAVHARGYVIGDINESNILAGADALVTLVDTDSFQVRDPATGAVYRCRVGRPEFTPPELHGVNFAEVDRAPEHDRFGLAVLLFQLLMEGTHPFAGVYAGTGETPTVGERIAAGHFAYARPPRARYTPIPSAPRFDLLHPELQTLFVRCFDEGHLRPSARPSADEWERTLAHAEASLESCRTNPQHVFGTHLPACPWCERARRLGGFDAFPPLGAQAPLPPAPRPTAPAPFPVLTHAPHVPAYTPPAPVPGTPTAQLTNPPPPGNAYAIATLLLALAGMVPMLRPFAWGLAVLSGALGIGRVSERGGAGRIPLWTAAAVVVVTLFTTYTPPVYPGAPAPPAQPPVATTPEPGPSVVVEDPVPYDPGIDSAAVSQPEPPPVITYEPPVITYDPPEAPVRAPRPRRTEPAPRVAQRPPEPVVERPREAPEHGSVARIRGTLAAAQAQKDQGAYVQAAATNREAHRAIEGYAIRNPGADVTELRQRARTLSNEIRQACQAEAALLGETGRCP
ncbi:MAG TPA: hypothetical protein VF613_16130 [Longimicrobium sp.]|jgi:serine/threonine protein kinase